MTAEMKAMLEGWLEHGTDHQKRHAAFALATEGFEPMTPELYSLLVGHLRDGTEDQRRRAEHRLAQPDAEGYDPAMVNARPRPLKAVPPVVHGDPTFAMIRACPHYQPGCCAHPAPWCDRYSINPTREQCVECLGIGS